MKPPNAVLLVSLILLASVPAGFSSTDGSALQNIVTRTVPLTIKVVLIGFDPNTIDRNFLNWKGNVIENSVNNVLSTGNITGISYNLTYEFVYTPPEFEQNLTTYLESIQQEKMSYNPWFRANTHNFLYDAAKTEDWFVANNASYGGFPTHGYIFVFGNLTSLPSITEEQLESEDPSSVTPHYYRTPYADKDLNYEIRYRDFSVAWGGQNRLWFLDLAAGPEFWTWSSNEAVPHVPMQVAVDLYKVNVHSSYGKSWLTEFLSDYVYDAVLNLAVPVFTYQPLYSHKYRIVVNIIDNRTSDEKDAVPIETTIHSELVKEAFADLLPYSDIEVESKLLSASENPGLQAAIIENTVSPPSDLATGRYVDARPVYRYLQEHLTDFVGTVMKDSEEVTVPVFGFALSSGIYFGYTYRWYVASLKVSEGSFLGISLGDMVLIGLTQDEFQRGDLVNPPQPGKGMGFTQTVIHEAGHALGLMHPHQFSYLEDFESSAMSYWSWEYKFSQFDKDAINRAHADGLITSALKNLTKAQNILRNTLYLGLGNIEISSAKSLVNRAIERYGSMDYPKAVTLAALAAQIASEALATLMSAPTGVVFTALVFLVIGIALGSLLIFLAMRKYTKELSRSG